MAGDAVGLQFGESPGGESLFPGEFRVDFSVPDCKVDCKVHGMSLQAYVKQVA